MDGVGVLGGTFDPPHIGHLLLAETARQQLDLQQVLFLPAGQPPHKRGEPVSAPRHRLAMTRLAVAGNRHFAVDTLDMARPRPHYTSTLLPLLQEQYPQQTVWLLIGGDSLRDLPGWHDPESVVAHRHLAVLARPGAAFDWDSLEAVLPGVRAAVTLLDGPSVAVSSTRIRQWAAQGRSLRYLCPPSVRDYIARQQLYQDAG